jgi:hypothetical protein
MVSTSHPLRRGGSIGVLAVVLCLLGACGRSVQSGQSASSITVTDKDQASTVLVQVGQDITVVLGSTYWTIDAPSDSRVLEANGAPRIVPDYSCVAGQGCGTVTQQFTAVGPGTATIHASRTSCGEGMGCTGANGSYAVTVRVQ